MYCEENVNVVVKAIEKVPKVYNSLCNFSFPMIIVKAFSVILHEDREKLGLVCYMSQILRTKRTANDEKLLRSASCQLRDYTVVDWRKNTIIRSNYNDLLQFQSDILIYFLSM